MRRSCSSEPLKLTKKLRTLTFHLALFCDSRRHVYCTLKPPMAKCIFIIWILITLTWAEECGKIPGIDPSQNRIIQGDIVEQPRPFMIKLRIALVHLCGGALISRKHILSAAHCFCRVLISCSYLDKGKPKMFVPRPSSVVVEFSVPPPESLEVSRVIIHPLYQSSWTPRSHDMAILELQTTSELWSWLSPICLPSASTPDLGEHVIASGYGRQGSINPLNTNCLTDQKGPIKFMPCFKRNCFNVTTPQREFCRNFFQRVEPRLDIDMFTFEKHPHKCYQPLSQSGWCHTTWPPEDDKWGFCMKSCHDPHAISFDNLKEVELEVYPETNCYPGDIDQQNELCIGGTWNKPMIGLYSELPNGTFALQGKHGGEKYNFYGYKDSCGGDSGGPIWTMLQGRAILLALVSRGEDCGLKNKPGIGTRVKMFLEWIDDITQGHYESQTNLTWKLSTDSLIRSSSSVDNQPIHIVMGFFFIAALIASRVE